MWTYARFRRLTASLSAAALGADLLEATVDFLELSGFAEPAAFGEAEKHLLQNLDLTCQAPQLTLLADGPVDGSERCRRIACG